MNLYLGVVDDAPPSAGSLAIEPEVWRAFTRHFADALHAIRVADPFRSATLTEWAVFTHQATSWVRAEHGLTQSELAQRTGLSVRTFRRAMLRLEALGLITPTHSAGLPAGYRPGRRLAELLRDLARRADGPPPTPAIRDLTPAIRDLTPAIRDRSAPIPVRAAFAKNLQRLRVDPSIREPVDVADGRTALLIKEITLTSSPPSSETETSANPTTPAPRPASTKRLDRDGIRAAACRALAAQFVFGKPGRVAPFAFSPEDVETLMNVTAHCSWTEAELDQAHRDAILGASLHSKAQPPTVGYVWGKQGFFDRNVVLGREKRKESEPVVKPPKKPKPPDEPPATFAELMEIGRRGVALLDGPARFESRETRTFDRTRFTTKAKDHE